MSECQTKSCCALPEPAASVNDLPSAHAGSLVIRIDQMDCPTEEGLLRQALGRLPGVGELSFNLV